MENRFWGCQRNLTLLLLVAVIGLSGCASNQIIAKKVKKEFAASALLNKYQVGFALYDLK